MFIRKLRRCVTKPFCRLLISIAPKKQKRDAWDYGGLDHEFFRMFGIKATDRIAAETTHGGMLKLLTELADERYTAIENLLKEKGFDMREVERRFLLLTVDKHWMDHIDAMDQLREGIGLRAMGNQDPLCSTATRALICSKP